MLQAFQNELQIPVENVMRLAVCRRCPRSHVALANELMQAMKQADAVPMQAMPSAAEGAILKDKDFVSHQPAQNDDHGILCRRNAPLLTLQYKLARCSCPISAA